MARDRLDILIDRMPPIPLAIVHAFVDACPEVSVVADDVGAAELPDAVAAVLPDVIILGNADALGSEADIARLLGPPEVHRRIVTLFGPDRIARLHEWRHSMTIVEDLSAAALRAAILGGGDG